MFCNLVYVVQESSWQFKHHTKQFCDFWNFLKKFNLGTHVKIYRHFYVTDCTTLQGSSGEYVGKRCEEVGYKKEQMKKEKTIIEREEEKERVSSGPARRGALGT